MIPQDDVRTFSIQIDWIAPELSVGGGNAGMLIMLLRSPDGAVVADMSWPYSLPDMSVTGMVNRVSMSSDVRGKVWLPRRIIDYPAGCPEVSQRDIFSLRAVRPHPVAEEYISGFCCNELLAVVVVTNEDTIAAGTLIDRGRYFDNVKKGDGKILWKLSSRAESSTALLEAALQGDSALISRLSLEGGKTLGRTLASASTFDGRIAESCARAAARDAVSKIDKAPAFDGHVPMTLRRIVSGGQSDGYELEVGLVGDQGYSRGDIRDVHDCLRWTFGMSRVVDERAIPPSAAEGGSAVRHLVLRWAFPAMSAAD
jgi:hypothetical protein